MKKYNKALLTAKVLRLIREIKNLDAPNHKEIMVSQAVALWLTELGCARSPSTVKDYTGSVQRYFSAVGDHPLEGFQVDFGARFMAYLNDLGLELRTVYKHLSNLQCFFNWAFRNNLTSVQVRLPRPIKTKKEPRIYTQSQLREIDAFLLDQSRLAISERFKALRHNQLRAFRMAVYTAMRGGEIWSLRLENIRLDTQVILLRDVPWIGFRVKGKREERIPIAPALGKFLETDLASRQPKEQWFLDDGQGKLAYTSETHLARPFSEINRALGIDGVKPLHGIRASVITHLLELANEITLVQKLARHTLITTTKGSQNTARQSTVGLVRSIM